MTKKPTGGPEDPNEPGTRASRASLEDSPGVPSPRGPSDATDRQNLADTLTVPLPPENRAGPRRPLGEYITPSPSSMDRTPVTDRYEGALDLMGIPDTESVLDNTPASTDSRTAGDGWFTTTAQPAVRREVSEAGVAPAPPVASGPPMAAVIGGTVVVLVVLFGVGFALFG